MIPLPGLVRSAAAPRRLRTVLAALALGLWLGAPGPVAAAATAEDPCRGSNLVEALRADGKLPAIEAAAAAVPDGEGKLFRIERDGVAPSFLFGTMHLSDPRVLTLPPAADAAFAASARLVIETTDAADPAKAAAAFFAHPEFVNLPRGETLASLLDPADLATVEAGLTARGIPLQAVETLQPWFTAVSLMLPACETARKEEGGAVLDTALAERATAEGKPVEGLETAAEQLEALASLSLDLQLESLVATVALSERMPDIMETMLALYLEGRIAMIMPAIEAAVPNGGLLVGAGEGYAEFERRVVTERNQRMVERMQPMLAKGGAFVAVGALHLPGESGLVALLREEGWEVSRADSLGPQ
ncbi:TraB/GumN family protein [Aurantimonas sp. HBX-1]|uniref:TraB/GumN family protein n=1 Tax=Aurantimonas sp. HBX-1 TaxID=2906072 RepID=UPI001F4366E9|nr:TraB/GumN family protein [Aurantimonas sp. HBX-1]UIJ71884.1 TraB/GumN family protein [Aurantimonas sp. HBX-1]